MRLLGHILNGLLALTLIGQVLGFVYVFGEVRGADRVRRDAVAYGLAIKEKDADGREVFRWKTTDELERIFHPAKKAKPKPQPAEPESP